MALRAPATLPHPARRLVPGRWERGAGAACPRVCCLHPGWPAVSSRPAAQQRRFSCCQPASAPHPACVLLAPAPAPLQNRRLSAPAAHGTSWKGVPLRLSVQLPAPQVRPRLLESGGCGQMGGHWSRRRPAAVAPPPVASTRAASTHQHAASTHQHAPVTAPPPAPGPTAVPVQGQRPAKQELELPANLPVGCLRRKLAEWLNHPPQLLRLLAGVSAGARPGVGGCRPARHRSSHQLGRVLPCTYGCPACAAAPASQPHTWRCPCPPPPHLWRQGRELASDCATLGACRAVQQLVMCTLSEKPNDYSGPDAVAEAACPTAALAVLAQVRAACAATAGSAARRVWGSAACSACAERPGRQCGVHACRICQQQPLPASPPFPACLPA